MIIDAVPFFDEIQLLHVRLNYLGPWVDKFVLIESTVDFSGESRQPVLTEEFIKSLPYAEKIEVICWRPETIWIRGAIKFSQIFRYRKGLWNIQHWQRNSLLSVIKKCQASDILIFGDLDEFPDVDIFRNRRHLSKLLEDNLIYSCQQIMYYYNIYSIMDRSWRGSVITTVSTAIEVSPKNLRKYRLDYPICAKGWHFSYFGDVQKIKKKIQAIADVEKLSSFKNITDEEIFYRMSNSADIYGRSDVVGSFCAIPDIAPELQTLIKQHLPHCA